MADYFTQSNTLVKKYRDYLQQTGEVDERPDTALTVELGNYWKEKGTFDDRVAEDPDFREQYLKATQATNRSYLGEVGAGLSRAGRGLAGTGMEAAAFGLDVVGADDWAHDLSDKAKEVAASGGKRVAPTVREMGDIRSVGGAVRYGLGKLGEAIPSIGEAFLTAGVGAALATPAGGPVGAAAGAITGFVGKQAIKQMLKSAALRSTLAKEIAGEVTEQSLHAALKAGTSEALTTAFGKQVINTARGLGMGAASAVNSYALSAGEIYGDTGSAGLSAVAGLVAAIPDTILPTYVASKFLRGPATKEAIEAAGNYWERFAKEGLKTIPGEMGAEAFQEFVGIAAEKYHNNKPITLDRADLKRIREAAVGGAAGGAIAAPIAAAPTPQVALTEEELEAQRKVKEEQLEARRKAATATAPEVYGPPAPKPPKPPAKIVPALMTPEQLDARHKSLLQLQVNGTISPEETKELGVIQALVSEREPGVADTTTTPTTTTPTPTTTTPAPTTTTPTTPAAGTTPPVVTGAASFQLPKDLRGAKPRYGYGTKQFELGFESELDKALYILAQANPSKRDADYLRAVTATGMTEAQARAAGAVVRERIKTMARDAAPGQLIVPATPAAVGPPVTGTPTPEVTTPAPTVTPPATLTLVEPAEYKVGDVIWDDSFVPPKQLGKITSIDETNLNTESGPVPKDKPYQFKVSQTGVPAAAAGGTAPVVGTAPGAAPVVTTPVTPLVKAPVVKPPTLEAMSKTVSTVGDQVLRLKKKAPALDFTEVSNDFDAIATNGATPERVAKLKASYDALEQASVAEIAKMQQAKLTAVTARAEEVRKKQQEAEAKKLKKEADAAAKAAATGVVSDEALKTAAETKLTPPSTFAAGEVKADDVVDIVSLSQGLAEQKELAQQLEERGELSEDIKEKLRKYDLPTLIAERLKEQTANKTGLFYGHDKNTALTRAGMAWLMPDKTVVQTGLLPNKELLRIGSTKKETGPAVQRMGIKRKETQEEAPDRPREKLSQIKLGGNNPVLIKDLIAFGATPLDIVGFNIKNPGEIFQTFPSEAAYWAARRETLRSGGKSVEEVAGQTAPGEGGETRSLVEVAESKQAEEAGQTAAEETVTPEEALEQARVAEIAKVQAEKLAAASARAEAVLKKQQEEAEAKKKKKEAPTKSQKRAQEMNRLVAEIADLEAKNVAVTKQLTDLSAERSAANTETRQGLTKQITALSKEYQDTAKKLEDAKEALAKLERRRAVEQDPRKKMGRLILRRQQFDALLRRLSDHGYNIEVLKAELGLEWGKIIGQGDEAIIVLAIEDMTNANLRNVVDLIHEVGHVEVDKLDPGMREQLSRAVDAAIETVQAGNLIDPATNADLNWEEKLVEQTAIKLGEEGFGTEAAGLATSIIRAVKDMYYRVGMAMMKSFGVEPDPKRVIAWFENNMRRRLGGDYDFGYIDLFSHLVEKAADRVTRFLAIDGTLIPEFVDPLEGLIRAEVLPDSVAAVNWNLNRFRENRTDLDDIAEVRDAQNQLLAPNGQPSKLSLRQWKIVRTDAFKQWFGDWEGDPEAHAGKLDENGEPNAKVRYRNSDESLGAELGMEYPEADARTQSAAYAEIIPILDQFKAEFGVDMTPQQFWKTFGGKGDTPQTLIELLETRHPGSTSARIEGEKMTDDMNQHARFLAFRIYNGLQWINRKRSAAEQERITDTSAKLEFEAERLNRTIREVRDADAQNSVFNENLIETIKELTADLDNGIKLGGLAGKLRQAIRDAEKLTEKEAIPREYQDVFKKILDAGGASVFEYMNAIAKLNLDLARSTVPEVMKAITDNAATDSTLAALAKNRPLMVALSSLARNSVRQMNLLQLRLSTNTAEYTATIKELDDIRKAHPAAIERLHEQIEAKLGSTTLRDRLTGELVKAKRDFNRSQRSIQKAQETSLARDRMADVFAAKATELAPYVGAFSYWEAHDGATYYAMQLDAQNNWTAVERTLQMKGTDISAQHAQVAQDRALNQLFLENEKFKRVGTPLYNTVKRQTRELGKLDLNKKYRAATRFWLDKVLASWAQKFGSVGDIHGKRVQQMLYARENVVFVHRDEVKASARRWVSALQEVAKASGFSNPMTFFKHVANGVLYRLDTGGLGLTTEEGLKVARKAALKRIPKHHTVADSFNEKMDKFILAHKETSEMFNRIKEEHGLFIKDPRVRDPLTGKGNLQRHAIKYGPVTAPRRLNAELVQNLITTMRQLGWATTEMNEQGEEVPLSMFGKLDPEDAPAAIAKYFNAEVSQIFVDPFMRKPGKEVFFGAADKNGRNAYVSQIQAQQAWEQAGGDVGAFIEVMFDNTNDAKNEDGTVNREGLGAYQVEMLKRFERLFKMLANIADKSSKQPDSDDRFGPKSNRIMDARTNEWIPPEHFEYEVFSELDALSYLNEIAFHSAFGRDATDLDQNITALMDGLSKKSRNFKLLPIAPKKERQAFAKEQGWDYDEIIRSRDDLQMVEKMKDQVKSFFTGQLGALGDARIIMEAAQFNMAMVMNTIKSGLMNVLQIADFPLLYRGLGPTAVKASWTATRKFATEITASIFTNFVNEASRLTQHDLLIGQLVDTRETSKLPLSLLRADIGAGGRFLEGGVSNSITKFLRGIRSQMEKSVGKGGFLPLAPFRWISHKVDIGIATANVQALESVVKRAMEFYEDHPEHNNPAYVLTAKDLKMDKGGFFSDEGAFEYFRERVNAYEMGTIENIVQEAMPRVMAGGTMLTREQAAKTAMMALDEVSLQSNTNTRPDWLTTNPIAKMGGLMLGWPLSRINSVNRAFGNAEGKRTLATAKRATAVMATWSIPMGLLYSLFMDEYEEKIQGKKSNVRELDPIALTPVVGPLLAVLKRPQNVYALTERLSRVGTYGLAGDWINGIINTVDPTSGQRDFDLNSRILLYSQLANFWDVGTNFMHQDFEMTYASVGRPLLTSLGGNSLFQAIQVINNVTGMTNAEQAYTHRISVNAYLRSGGRDAGISLRSGARSSPTAQSVWYQQMALTAMANDRAGFAEAYRKAVDVARERGEDEPEKVVLTGFKARHPLITTYAGKPTDLDLRKAYSAMPEAGQRAVSESLRLFEQYTELISPDPLAERRKQQMKAQLRALQPPTFEQMRRRVASGAMGY